MKNWFRRFMAGRYGFDQFSAFLSVCSLVCILLGTWFSAVLYWGGLALLAYFYYRTLSRNFYQRRAENSKYLLYRGKVTAWFGKYRMRFKQRKQYKYFRCPGCRQELRVPRGRGSIAITCPKCHTHFTKKS